MPELQLVLLLERRLELEPELRLVWTHRHFQPALPDSLEDTKKPASFRAEPF